MNRVLMEEIVRHVFSNLAVIPSNFVDVNKTKSLMSKDFILNSKLTFDNGTSLVENKVWGCQISSDPQDIIIMLGDCALDKNAPEYCLIVQLKNAPAYGLYLANNSDESVPLIACTLNGEEWMECPTYLQATFLAGMEQIREAGLSWNKCNNYKDQYELMVSFIDFHEKVYGVSDEGEED